MAAKIDFRSVWTALCPLTPTPLPRGERGFFASKFNPRPSWERIPKAEPPHPAAIISNAGPDLDLVRLEAALRLHRRILRRRLLAFAGLAVPYLAWAVATGGWAWLPSPFLALAGIVIVLQYRARPGQDYREALLAVAARMLGDLGFVADLKAGGIPHDGDEARLSLSQGSIGITVVTRRRPDGTGLVMVRCTDAPERQFTRVLPRPPLRLSWESSAVAMRADLDALRAALRAFSKATTDAPAHK